MLKNKEITWERKLQKKNWGKLRSFLFQANPPLESEYPIIDNFSLSYNLVECYVSPILLKCSNKICWKRFHYVKDSKFLKTYQRSCLYLLPKFHKLLFLLLKTNFEKKLKFVNQVSNLKRCYNSCDPWQKYVV
jgi:hypothetical protein